MLTYTVPRFIFLYLRSESAKHITNCILTRYKFKFWFIWIHVNVMLKKNSRLYRSWLCAFWSHPNLSLSWVLEYWCVQKGLHCGRKRCGHCHLESCSQPHCFTQISPGPTPHLPSQFIRLTILKKAFPTQLLCCTIIEKHGSYEVNILLKFYIKTLWIWKNLRIKDSTLFWFSSKRSKGILFWLIYIILICFICNIRINSSSYNCLYGNIVGGNVQAYDFIK
jgi:hypothetical protein